MPRQQPDRAAVLATFADFEFGHGPGPGPGDDYATDIRAEAEDASLLDGRAVLRQWVVDVIRDGRRNPIHVAIFLPVGVERPPTLLGCNFDGNYTTTDHPAMLLTDSWVRHGRHGREGERETGHVQQEKNRGFRAYRWPVHAAIDAGFAVATIYNGDMWPDDRSETVPRRLGELFDLPSPRRPGDFGAVAAWAFGLSRALDVLVREGSVDAKRVTVFGHSRNGKAALWAAARDERLAACISNQSGCGGDALFRGMTGETIADIVRQFPFWFCPRFAEYAGRQDETPLDHDQLLALIAPRPLLVCAAADDAWAGPASQLAACRAAEGYFTDVAQLPPELPPENTLVGGPVAFHIRPGKHNVGLADWEVFLRFCKDRLAGI
ncbi:MAG: alpha/beta hydrolase family protein [Phycisphaerae bacterium]